MVSSYANHPIPRPYYVKVIIAKLAYTVFQDMPDWSVSLRQGDGSSGSFQSAQSKVTNPTQWGECPCYVLLEHRHGQHERLELHGSLQWQGRSGARHEMDISVLPALIGEALRNNGGGYPHGLPITAVECKDKGGVGPLDETRQTLARMYDVVLVTRPHPNWSCRIFETRTQQRWGNRSSRYVTFFARGTFGIVRAGNFQAGAAVLAGHYSIRHLPNIYTNANSIDVLQLSFRETLTDIASF